MMRAHAGFRAERLQRQWLFIVLIDRMTNATHKFDLRIEGARSARMATTAGAETCFLGGFRNLKEADLFRSWPARRARWPAIDSGGADSKHKTAIARSIS